MQEIERKYLVRSDNYKSEAIDKKYVVQGFLNTHPSRTVRIRIMEDKAFLTVKGPSNPSGTTRFEWECPVRLTEAKALIELCEPPVMEKYRYFVPFGPLCFEVDEFLGENLGLVIAEVELNEERQAIQKPSWLGEEVTGQIQYYNSQLTKKPYNSWK